MSTTTDTVRTAPRLAVFGVVVGAIFGGAMAVGAAAGPIDVGGGEDHNVHNTATAGQTDAPRGLAVSTEGFRLDVDTEVVPAESPSQFTFRILDDAGSPVLDFDELHERRLHLIVLSRNLVDYWPPPPTIDTATGEWTVDLPALTPGSYRVFADFQPAGAGNLTLGTDITVPGTMRSVDVPERSQIDTVDAYTVSLAGNPRSASPSSRSPSQWTASRCAPSPTSAPPGIWSPSAAAIWPTSMSTRTRTTPTTVVTFTGEFPTAGTYRLFFDFSHDGTVHTAAFTVEVPDAAVDSTPSSDVPGSGHDEGH